MLEDTERSDGVVCIFLSAVPYKRLVHLPTETIHIKTHCPLIGTNTSQSNFPCTRFPYGLTCHRNSLADSVP